jgi:hypothetical protein
MAAIGDTGALTMSAYADAMISEMYRGDVRRIYLARARHAVAPLPGDHPHRDRIYEGAIQVAWLVAHPPAIVNPSRCEGCKAPFDERSAVFALPGDVCLHDLMECRAAYLNQRLPEAVSAVQNLFPEYSVSLGAMPLHPYHALYIVALESMLAAARNGAVTDPHQAARMVAQVAWIADHPPTDFSPGACAGCGLFIRHGQPDAATDVLLHGTDCVRLYVERRAEEAVATLEGIVFPRTSLN